MLVLPAGSRPARRRTLAPLRPTPDARNRSDPGGGGRECVSWCRPSPCPWRHPRLSAKPRARGRTSGTPELQGLPGRRRLRAHQSGGGRNAELRLDRRNRERRQKHCATTSANHARILLRCGAGVKRKMPAALGLMLQPVERAANRIRIADLFIRSSEPG
jgi:hypothetical protein